ncbi:hypothetical protein [Streptomonospora litoralis]|uniref:Uncharacterized protein n=1 Tax=Streptomonospora litoralis TaxID=2498135 RepID=A0A4P6Q6A4_9ACTN|nr:hypothetical protein [Streptomonospora litoralis]QBI54317.1 hypothetical protein EKD16_12675 [Streptomonospora litoralis]
MVVPMVAALHGELEPFAGSRPDVAERDAFSLFYDRSSAMIWLQEAVPDAYPGLWAMNDAGQDGEADIGRGATRRLWFQVHLTGSLEDDRPLPLQPFLSCIGDVAERLGTLEVHALQLLVPVHERVATRREVPRHSAGAVGGLIEAAGWFGDGDPGLARRVQVTIDTGQDPAVVSAAPGLPAWMRRWKQSFFVCDPASDEGDAAADLSPQIPDHFWQGPRYHRTSLYGTLGEWSPEALGWLSAFAAEAAWQQGVRIPLMITVRTR